MRNRYTIATGAALAAMAAFFAAAQSNAGGARLAAFRSTVDGSEQEYALYVPRTYDPARKYPLIVGLHEEESNHIAELKHLFAVPARYGENSLQTLLTLPVLPDVDFVVACPFARGMMGYQGAAEQDVYDMIAEVKRRYRIDEDRVYLTGASMGGGAALWMALSRPDQWAAVAPVCAAVVPRSEDLAGNALHLPVRLFHGEMDPLVPAASSRQWQKRLLDLGAAAEYVEYPGARHNAWDYAYRRPGLFQWFAEHQRVKAPDHVRFSTRQYRYNAAYWLRIDGLTPGELASVDAVRHNDDVRVVTQNVEAFTLTVPAKTVTVDGAPVKLRVGTGLSFVKSGGRWGLGARAPSGKVPGLEGPIVDAFRGRHLYVYGTGGAAGDAEIAGRRAIAETAAAWSSPRARLREPSVVKADREVTGEEIAEANLVLFGTRESNTLVARFAARWPLELSPGAADYGVVFVAPVGERYAVVSSGLPWWTGADEVDRGGYQFAPPPYRLLSTFGDYVVFRGGLKNVLAEGRFDRDWKMPKDAAERLRGSGVVTVR